MSIRMQDIVSICGTLEKSLKWVTVLHRSGHLVTLCPIFFISFVGLKTFVSNKIYLKTLTFQNCALWIFEAGSLRESGPNTSSHLTNNLPEITCCTNKFPFCMFSVNQALYNVWGWLVKSKYVQFRISFSFFKAIIIITLTYNYTISNKLDLMALALH